MGKRALSLMLAFMMVLGCLSIISEAATTKLIPTNIPKTFPVVKADPSFTQITFWHAMTSTTGTQVENLAKWFNATEGKKKKIYVNAGYQGDYDATTLKLQAILQAKNTSQLPDLVQLSLQGMFSIKESSQVIYMEDMMKTDKTFTFKDKLDPAALYASSYNGKQLGMPFSNSCIVLFYNADAFKAAGLDPNKPPKTLAEYTEDALKLMIKGTGSKPRRYGGVNKVYTYQFATWIPRQKGGTAFEFDNEDGHKGTPTKLISAEDGTMKAALTEWGKACKSGAVNYKSNTRMDYQSGNACMFTGSIMGYEVIDDYMQTVKPEKRFETLMARLPAVNANDSMAEAASGSYMFMFDKKDAKRKDATWQFVKFLLSVDASAYWYVASGYFPANSDALNTKYVQDDLAAKPAKKFPLTIRAESAKFYKFQEPLIPNQQKYSDLLGDQCALIGDGKATVDQALEKIKTGANTILEQYRKANAK